MAFAQGRYSGRSINVHTEKRISRVLCCGCCGCCHSVGGRDVERNAICCRLRGAARRGRHGAAARSTARRSPGARGPHKPFGSRAGGKQCPAPAPGPSYVWLCDRGDVRICDQRRAKSSSESRRYILRAAWRGSLHISKSKHRQACKNCRLHGCGPEEPEHGCRVDCIDREGKPRIFREARSPGGRAVSAADFSATSGHARTRSSSAGVTGVKKMNMFATTMVTARK
jgi:hypothetical protein